MSFSEIQSDCDDERRIEHDAAIRDPLINRIAELECQVAALQGRIDALIAAIRHACDATEGWPTNGIGEVLKPKDTFSSAVVSVKARAMVSLRAVWLGNERMP